MKMSKIEILAMAITKQTGGLDDPSSRAFKTFNPGLLKTYRPEKKQDSENYRIFTTFAGGFKALCADLAAKCGGQNQSLSPDLPLKELLVRKGFKTDTSWRPIILYLRKGIGDEAIVATTPLTYFVDTLTEKEN
jgi:hypothetical protein